MELKQLIAVVKRWYWLLAIGLLAGAVGGFVASKSLTPVFEAKSKVLVARTQQQKNSDVAYLNEQQFIETNMELIQTKPVLDATSSKLGFEIDENNIQIQQVRTTQVMEVMVQDSDPEQAAAIANTLVQAFLEQKGSLDSERYDSAEQALQAQISQVETQIANLQDEFEQAQTADVEDQLAQVDTQIASLQDQVSSLQAEIATMTPARTQVQQTQLAQKQDQLGQIQPILYLYQQIRANLLFIGKPAQSGVGPQEPYILQLQSTLDLYQQIYLSLINSLESIRLAKMQNAPTISVVEEATVPKAPVRPLPVVYTLLAGIVGLILAASAAFLIEHLNDTITTIDDVERSLEVPVVGSIVETPRINQPGNGIYLVSHPNTATAEAFRLLRISFNFFKGNKALKTIAILSPNPGDGKSTVAVNLAALFAQGGKRVTLVDANLRQPQLHKLLGIDNQNGASELLSGTTDVQSVSYSLGDGQGFEVIPGGVLPVHPAELLESDNMERAITKVKKNADIILLDGPPLMFAEAQLLASKVDGVLLVMRPGVTSTATARTLMSQLNRVGAHVVGVALNRMSSKTTSQHYIDNARMLKNDRNRLMPLVKKMFAQRSNADVNNEKATV